MQYNRLGASELVVSDICLGTMTYGHQNDEADAHAQIERALERGVNFIDTAEMYPVPPRAESAGRTEQYIGSWLAANPERRKDIVLATKIAGRSNGLDWLRGGGEKPKVDRSNIRRAIEGSLQRLQTDYIDLYQIHWPDRNAPKFGGTRFNPDGEFDPVPIREQLEALKELVDEGKIRYVGLSNESAYGVDRFVRLAEELDLPRVVSIQNAYSLVNRVFEHGLDESCFHHNVGLLPYSSLAFGHLTGKYLDGAQPEGARLTVFPEFGGRYASPYLEPAVREYVRIAREAGLDPAQMALAFARQQFFTSSVIIGATTREQLDSDLDSGDLTLTPDVLEAIDEVHARYPNPAP
jgi:aryl-alcohol dehydrogenase (NADP+)